MLRKQKQIQNLKCLYDYYKVDVDRITSVVDGNEFFSINNNN